MNRFDDRIENKIAYESELFNSEKHVAKYREVMKLFEVRFKWSTGKIESTNVEIEKNHEWISEHFKDVEAFLDRSLLKMTNQTV